MLDGVPSYAYVSPAIFPGSLCQGALERRAASRKLMYRGHWASAQLAYLPCEAAFPGRIHWPRAEITVRDVPSKLYAAT